METFELHEGAIVHIQGLPFEVVGTAVLRGHPANIELIKCLEEAEKR